MASPMLLDLDLPAGNIGATSLGTHARHLALCLACSGLKSFMEKTGSLTTLSFDFDSRNEKNRQGPV